MTDKLEKILEPYKSQEETQKIGKVMVVDDDPGIREALADILDKQGYEVLLYKTGEEAIPALNESVSAVVLDAKLPKLDGSEVYKRMKEIRDVPIIFHTAYIGEDSAPYNALEPFDYVIKGEETERLYSAIERAVFQYDR
jgi:DNA-binding NtrC family response regulator